MAMTWERIAREPKEKHSALIKLYSNDLVEQCWDEHLKKRKGKNKSAKDFLEHIKASGRKISSKVDHFPKGNSYQFNLSIISLDICCIYQN